ncbi:hypothetical protein WIV_gp155 [Wiseana iridescent virus]|uniref:Uncharacterized protein n=1 Tax=Wiseana iridescent virus TaxID=68347 RepID=G0T5I1_IRV9|nr:hypothetical protein WIV_gp155 [Wiseana iridescent virus]ADO00499.1 hypothetical protein [Wiseana iridescent virus]
MDIRHVGWDSTSWGQKYNESYYSPSVTSWISDAVTLKTKGLDKRLIRVTDQVINHVLDSFLSNHRSFPGDIHTRYNIPGDGNFSGDFGVVKFDNIGLNNLSYMGDVQSNILQKSINNNVGLSSNYIINQVVEYITENIKTEYQINANNKRYSAWSALYGANDVGLRAHSQIKLREKRPTPFQFHMKF